HLRHRAAGREDGHVEARGVGGGRILHHDVLPAEGERRARAARRGEETDLGDREVPLHEEAAYDRADLTGGAHDAETDSLVAAHPSIVPASGCAHPLTADPHRGIPANAWLGRHPGTNLRATHPKE